jgi:hypothetical protein
MTALALINRGKLVGPGGPLTKTIMMFLQAKIAATPGSMSNVTSSSEGSVIDGWTRVERVSAAASGPRVPGHGEQINAKRLAPAMDDIISACAQGCAASAWIRTNFTARIAKEPTVCQPRRHVH